MEKRNNRRSSILKVRQHVDIDIDETTAGNGLPGASTTTTNRRVSFHNVKHVKQYDRDHGKLIDASPLREKITDTMDSDGILTPRGRNLDANETAGNQTMNVFANMNHDNKSADMSLETVNENGGNETMKLFNITREQTLIVEKTVTTTRVTERRVESVPDSTMALFNMTDCGEKDMTLDQSDLFSAPRTTNATVNQSVMMDLDESNVVPVNNDTMSLFNMSVVSARDMDISNATVNETFKAPKTLSVMPRVFEENEEDVDMELTNMEEPEKVQIQKTMVLNESMDISVAPGTPKCSNETMSLFRSPARLADQSDMVLEETKLPESARTLQKTILNESMDISVMQNESPKVPAGPNDTMNLFRSPARQFNCQQPPTSTVFEEKPIPMNQSMDISVLSTESRVASNDNDNTMALFKSPARKRQSVLMPSVIAPEPFDDSTGVEMKAEEETEKGTLVIPTGSPKTSEAPQSPEQIFIPISVTDQAEMMITEEACTVDAREEKRAMAEMSMMDVSEILESPTHLQKSLILQAQVSDDLLTHQESNASRHDSADISVNETSLSHEESMLSPQKTMQLETDMTSTIQEMTPIQNESESMVLEEKSMVKQHETVMMTEISMKMDTSTRRKSASFVSRRRSLLRESVLESPRRIALENSMITMNVAEMTALSEQRRRKSIQNQQNASNSSNISMLNESANMSKARDIFALNTSVRSPSCAGSLQSANSSIAETVTVPDVPSFHMPNFDPAVTNIVWLTPEEGEGPIPEAEEFARLVAAEKIKAEKHIQRTLLDENVDKQKSEAVRSGEWSKLSHDEKEAVLVARQDAEIKFLELRLSFAEKTRQRYEQEAKDLLESNARMAEQLEDVENMDALRAEIDELKDRPTEEDYQRVEKEYRLAELESYKWKHIALQQTLATIEEMEEQKNQLKMEIEVREEVLARLEAKENLKKKELVDAVKAM